MNLALAPNPVWTLQRKLDARKNMVIRCLRIRQLETFFLLLRDPRRPPLQALLVLAAKPPFPPPRDKAAKPRAIRTNLGVRLIYVPHLALP
ncbi:hypothetical protein JCM10908_006962 [Rhodotorula pacifica]|uniref:uncharacterized protein n=1 Tax=Rhodotorula pacifica TaxID=1495444 RepID=UPI00317BC9B4